MSPNEQKLLDDLKRLQSGQDIPDDWTPEYLQQLGQAMQFIQSDAELREELIGDAEEAAYETQRGAELTESGLDPSGTTIIDVTGSIESDGSVSFTAARFNDQFNLDVILQYIGSFTSQKLGKKFWEQVALKPLRRAIDAIFRTQGFGTWKAHGPLWGRLRSDIGLQAEASMILGRPLHIRQTSVSHFQRGGGGILNWRGRYRNALVRASGIGKGAFLEPTDGDWRKGFEYGIDQPHFDRFTRRVRGDHLESGGSGGIGVGYPSKHEVETPAQFYYFWLTPPGGKHTASAQPDAPAERVIVTGRERRILESKDIPVYFSGVYKGSKLVSKSEETGERTFSLPEGRAQVTVPARPVWTWFRTGHGEITKFYEKVGNNIANEIEKYLSLGQRTRWRGDATTQVQTLEDLPGLYQSGLADVPEHFARGIRENPQMRQRYEEQYKISAEEQRESRLHDPESWMDTEEDAGSTGSWEEDYNFDDFN